MRPSLARAVAVTGALVVASCSRPSGSPTTTSASNEPIPARPSAAEPSCHLVEKGFGPEGTARVRADIVVNGLEVPWSIAFLPGTSDFFVSERPGRIRLVRGESLVREPVATLPVADDGEHGLLGLALHPAFRETRFLYAYYTMKKGDANVNRVARYVVDDAMRAREDRIVIDDIPAASYHDGGRLRFGPDGMLYVATGDARSPDRSQDPASPAGKLLRLAPDGAIPRDNPRPGSAVFLSGIRNLQAFDFLDDGRIALADHGPSGDLGRRGHDEVSVAKGGQNLGWPRAWACERGENIVTPLLVWEDAAPPGGAAYYRDDAIAGWKNSFVVATLRSEHLQRIVFDPDRRRVVRSEIYFAKTHGRLRDVVVGPDAKLYVTTSNCDGRGKCPDSKDAVLRISSMGGGDQRGDASVRGAIQ